ncbi:eCIS core domain-containing protein [Nostoc sp.]|uniref:eCIS core domain-containing protein n=1 Tax=Nostoc sp. TaxID=1180 RepID=UPI002FEEBEAC
MREHISRQKKTTTGFSIPSLKHPIRGFGLESSAISRQAPPEVQPLHKPLTHDISRIPLRNPQAKLSISQPGDIYEQEADSVAQQVMQRMAQSVNRQSIQREALPEDEEELQMKSLDNSTLQREELPEDEEELQMMPMVQRRAEAGMAAAPDVEASINQARGGGQAMADNIRQPMEQAFGADFSRVKVHTDAQSDQLNKSIQAKAFTTGQDVFFRQGEYEPGSRSGQELLAHELTHTVQQKRGNLSAQYPRSEAQEIAGRSKTVSNTSETMVMRWELEETEDYNGVLAGEEGPNQGIAHVIRFMEYIERLRGVVDDEGKRTYSDEEIKSIVLQGAEGTQVMEYSPESVWRWNDELGWWVERSEWDKDDGGESVSDGERDSDKELWEEEEDGGGQKRGDREIEAGETNPENKRKREESEGEESEDEGKRKRRIVDVEGVKSARVLTQGHHRFVAMVEKGLDPVGGGGMIEGGMDTTFGYNWKQYVSE